jgi:hypothetical protein
MALATGRWSSHHPELSSFDDLPYLEDPMDSDPLEDNSYICSSGEFESSNEFPLFDPPFIEEMHTLTGATHAENMRHIIARIELLNCFSEDPRVIARISSYKIRT